MAVGKSKRTKKVSKGVHGGGGKVRNLTEVQKVLMGGGLFRTIRVLAGKDA